MVSNTEVLQWGRFHLRPLRLLLCPYIQIMVKRDLMILVLLKTCNSFFWWTKSHNRSKGKPFHRNFFTDTSLQGWRVILNDCAVQSTWSLKESQLPINLLAFRAIHLALLHFADRIKDCHVLIGTDNVSAKVFLYHQGSLRSNRLHREAAAILSWAETQRNFLCAEHIKGSTNVQVDWLSRGQIQPGEWILSREVFLMIMKPFGSPVVDLLATPENAQVDQFFMRFFHWQVEGIDAITSNWPPGLLHGCPQIPIVTQLLKKIQQKATEVIPIAPWWPWWP